MQRPATATLRPGPDRERKPQPTLASRATKLAASIANGNIALVTLPSIRIAASIGMGCTAYARNDRRTGVVRSFWSRRHLNAAMHMKASDSDGSDHAATTETNAPSIVDAHRKNADRLHACKNNQATDQHGSSRIDKQIRSNPRESVAKNYCARARATPDEGVRGYTNQATGCGFSLDGTDHPSGLSAWLMR